MNNLPKVVTQRCLEQDLNPRATDRKSNSLHVVLPRHLCCPLRRDNTCNCTRLIGIGRTDVSRDRITCDDVIGRPLGVVSNGVRCASRAASRSLIKDDVGRCCRHCQFVGDDSIQLRRTLTDPDKDLQAYM